MDCAYLLIYLAGGDLGYQELSEGLPVSIFSLVVLFRLHLVHNNLLTLKLFQYFCLNCDIV